MHPSFRVSGVTGAFTGPGGLALSCVVVDEDGREDGKAVIALDDRNGVLQVPPVDTEIEVEMGYEETGLESMGQFRVEKVILSGWPRSMVVHGKAISWVGKMKQQRTQEYHNKDLEYIAQDQAAFAGLRGAVVDPDLAAYEYEYLAQTAESPANFMTRLSPDHDAVAKVLNDQLYYFKKGQSLAQGSGGTTEVTSGTAEFPINVKWYEATIQKARPAYNQSQAGYGDIKKGEREEVLAPGSSTVSDAIYMQGKYFHDGQKLAEESAKSAGNTLIRRLGDLDILIIGDPGIMSESRLQVINVRDEVDGEWLITKVQHTMDNSGYETLIHAELTAGGTV